ncbi:phage terminase small subunit [Serratia fonticola]|uniref:phage terminase small subunit n=1 Tax=Serratia fonticola TaxID=47917 RepID=UPI003BB5BAC0
MLTPARRHFESVMAQRRGDVDAPLRQSETAYEQQLFRLENDKRRLKRIESVKAKVELKKELLPAYEGWLDGVLKADSGQADEIVTTCMIWHIDAGNYGTALPLAEYVIRHGIPLPDHYERGTACLIVDEIADAALSHFKIGDTASAPVSLDILLRIERLTDGLDMPDEARAKLYKAIGFTLRDKTEEPDLAASLSWLQRAMALNANIGVVKDVQNLIRAISKASLDEAGGEGSSTVKGDGSSSSLPEITTDAAGEMPDAPATAKAPAPKKPAASKKTAAPGKKPRA